MPTATADPQTLAKEIVSKARQQVGDLIGNEWPEISRILEKDGEIKLAMGITLTNRDAEPGTQSDKDSRIRTTIAFAEKFSDWVESTLDDGQTDLPLE
jgi:hypothetical protein